MALGECFVSLNIQKGAKWPVLYLLCVVISWPYYILTQQTLQTVLALSSASIVSQRDKIYRPV